MINEILKTEIKELYNEGNKLLEDFSCDIVIQYQIWYSKAHRIVSAVIPERLYDFESQCDIKKGNLTIHGYFTSGDTFEGILENKKDRAIKCFTIQLGILKSCLNMIDYRLKNIKSLVQADLFDNQLDSAKNLLKNGYIRASEAICGVVLETHFNSVLLNHNLNPNKKTMHLSDYNELLKNEDVYDIATWRKLQYLSDIRNKCDHDKGIEPNKEELEDLIKGCKAVIKTIY